MSSPLGPIVANLYMEQFAREALQSATTTPMYWFRHVNDTWVIQQQAYKQVFLDHINSMDPAIQFTVIGNQDSGATPFLDTLVTPQADIPSLLQSTTSPPTLTSTYRG